MLFLVISWLFLGHQKLPWTAIQVGHNWQNPYSSDNSQRSLLPVRVFMDTSDDMLSLKPVQHIPHIPLLHHFSRHLHVCQALQNCHNMLTIPLPQHQSDIEAPDDVPWLLKEKTMGAGVCDCSKTYTSAETARLWLFFCLPKVSTIHQASWLIDSNHRGVKCLACLQGTTQQQCCTDVVHRAAALESRRFWGSLVVK